MHLIDVENPDLQEYIILIKFKKLEAVRNVDYRMMFNVWVEGVSTKKSQRLFVSSLLCNTGYFKDSMNAGGIMHDTSWH